MQVNMEGVVVGIVALVMIGVFHPIVIKCEYYFSHRIWPLFLAAGIGFLLAALFTEGMLSMAQRVEKGWFPKNPNRKEPMDCTK